jgi:hypothetical protein
MLDGRAYRSTPSPTFYEDEILPIFLQSVNIYSKPLSPAEMPLDPYTWGLL